MYSFAEQKSRLDYRHCVVCTLIYTVIHVTVLFSLWKNFNLSRQKGWGGGRFQDLLKEEKRTKKTKKKDERKNKRRVGSEIEMIVVKTRN